MAGVGLETPVSVSVMIVESMDPRSRPVQRVSDGRGRATEVQS